jgi:hypothetical protein
MTRLPAPGPSSRSSAVGELFAALEGLMIAYHALPDGEREQRWATDAELITGAVALHLSTARTRISARGLHRPALRPPAPDPVPPTPAGSTDDRRPA